MFVILGCQRSGTTMLTTCLQSHPKIVCLYEIFLQDDYLKNINFYNFWLTLIEENRENISLYRPALVRKFIEIVSKHENNERALGFNIKYDQLFLMPEIWGIFKEQNIGIIHITRKNLLKSFVSQGIVITRQKLANNTKANSTIKPPQIKVNLDTKTLVIRLGIQRENIKFFSSNLLHGKLNSFEVTYEALTENTEHGISELPQNISKQIHEFIGINEFHALNTDTKKMNSDILEECIENYDDVFKTLKGTEFEFCLEK